MNAQRSSISLRKIACRKKLSRHERTASRLRRLARASSCVASGVALLIGILICTTPALAGTVVQSASVAFEGATGANQQNITVSSLDPIVLQTMNKDEAFSSGVLNGPMGNAKITIHACSGPPTPGSGGAASAGVNLDFFDLYQITSDTLPVGTPVFISIIASAARGDTTTLDVDSEFENTFNSAQSNGQAQVSFSLPGALYKFAGSFSHRINLVDGVSMFKEGLFDGLDQEQLKTIVGGTLQGGVVSALVGDHVGVSVFAGAGVQSTAAYRATTDADVQMTVNWGLHPFDSAIKIINVTYPPDAVPNPPEMSIEEVIAGLPPRPPTVTPEPASLILWSLAFAPGIAIPRRRCLRHPPSIA